MFHRGSYGRGQARGSGVRGGRAGLTGHAGKRWRLPAGGAGMIWAEPVPCAIMVTPTTTRSSRATTWAFPISASCQLNRRRGAGPLVPVYQSVLEGQHAFFGE